MTTHTIRQLVDHQLALEKAILANVRHFEERTGMSVHAIKVFRGSPQSDGSRSCEAVEVAAQLR